MSASSLNWEDIPLPTCYVPWEEITIGSDQSDASVWRQRATDLIKNVNQFSPTEYSKLFFQNQLALIVFDSNKMEGTIPVSLEEGASLLKICNYLQPDCVEPEVVDWDSEGGRETHESSTDRQLFQFAKAVQFLLVDNRDSPLTLELIEETHRIMMANSYVVVKGVGKVPLSTGAVRTTKEVNAGFYQFLPASCVKNATIALAKEYSSPSRAQSPIKRAVELFYEMVTIHPFENGNGRLCRLFLAWSLLRDGFPFVVSFSSGHKKRRQHYLHAIERVRRTDNYGELVNILIVSMERVLSNYDGNVRWMNRAKAEE